MAKKVSSFWAMDWNSILRITALLVTGVMVLFFAFNISFFGMLYQGIGKKGLTKATIINRREISTNVQTISKGNKTKMDKLMLTYTFTVGNISRIDSCVVSYSFLNAKTLNMIYTHDLPVDVKIKYNPYKKSDHVLWLVD